MCYAICKTYFIFSVRHILTSQSSIQYLEKTPFRIDGGLQSPAVSCVVISRLIRLKIVLNQLEMIFVI